MIKIVVTIAPPGSPSAEREIARAQLGDLSRVGPPFTGSDYSIWASETENPEASTASWESRGMIGGQDRRQSIWELVAAAAKWAAGQADARSRG